MHLNISVENYDNPQQIRSLANALTLFANELETNGRTSGQVGYAVEGSAAAVLVTDGIDGVGQTSGQTPDKPKRTRKPAAVAAPEPEPEDDPDLPPEDSDDGEESEPEPPAKEAKAKHNGKAAGDDKALRQEVLERFASFADEAGVLEGKSLLGEFNATKFSEVAGTDLRAFAKRLTVLEASL
jgi:hypothetical protein